MLPTKEEKKAIDRLRRALKAMPDHLWLFNNGDIHVMRKGADGRRVMKPGVGGAVDDKYSIATINDIESDGGGF